MPGATTVVTTEVGVDAWEEKQTRHNPPPPPTIKSHIIPIDKMDAQMDPIQPPIGP